MLRHRTYLLLASIVSLSSAIRVDWNTNTGPIIPPTTRQPPIPKQPYRQPAPVWENSEDDAPNPSPYHYILPPPSRARPATDNYARASPAELQHLTYQSPKPHYGQFVGQSANSLPHNVPTLGVQYVPNKGFEYYAVAPSGGKSYYNKDVDNFDKYNKLNGKFNAKLKKHKAYEKVKHVKYNKKSSTKYQQQTETPVPYSSSQQPIYAPKPTYQGRHTQVDYNSPASRQDIYYRPQNVWRGFVNSQR